MKIERGPHEGMFFGENDRYFVGATLGAGGFAWVYAAKDAQTHFGDVVVKVLRDPCPSFLRKFDREIEAMRRIRHPNVVRVLDSGHAPDGRPFLVISFAKGQVLRTLIDACGMDLIRAAGIIRQLGDALEAVHREGVLHLDLKPENVMVGSANGKDWVHLFDFGIAQLIGQSVPDSTLIAHTPHYAAPEQLEHPSALSDIFSFGAVAYELLTGVQLFAQGQKSPDPCAELRRLRPGLPAAVEPVLRKATAADPNVRWASALEMAEALAGSLISVEPRPRIMGQLLGTYAAVIGAVLTLSLGLLLKPPQPPSTPAKTAVPVMLHVTDFRTNQPAPYASVVVSRNGVELMTAHPDTSGIVHCNLVPGRYSVAARYDRDVRTEDLLVSPSGVQAEVKAPTKP